MDRKPQQYEQQKEMSRAWKKAHPERHAELARAYRARNREKTAAQNRLNYAIRQGLLARQPCRLCAATEKVHAHHDDYGRPLDVDWLCFRCHKSAHPVGEEQKRVKFSGAQHARLIGEANHNALLTNEQARQVRKMLEIGGISQEKIGAVFGVTQNTISRIKLNKGYATAEIGT